MTGINHFTWLYSTSYQGQDLFPLYRRFVDKYYETGFSKGKDDNWMTNVFDCSHRVKLDLFRRYGQIAAAGDRHLAEFMPPWYLKNPETARSWGFGLTTVDWQEEDLKRRLARREAMLDGREPIVLDGSGEEGHLLMKALLGLGDMISNVNIPNRGQVENLPKEAVVETNALFRRDKIDPVLAGPMPKGVDGLVTRHVLNQESIVKTAMTCDFELGLATFLSDPQLSAVSPADGERMFREMLQNTKEYMPKEWEAAFR